MKNIKRLISIPLILISIWIIRYVPFFMAVEYPKAASLLMSVILMFSFVLLLSTFPSKNRMLDNLRVLIMVFSVIGIFPGIYFNYKYILRATESILLRDGIIGRAVVTDKKIGTSSSGKNNITRTYYELYFSFVTNETKIAKSIDRVSEKIFESIHVKDSLNVVYLPGRPDIVELIITKNDSAFYAAKMKPIH